MIHDGLWCAFECWHMGEAADYIAGKCGVSRSEQDRFAVRSHQQAAAAWERGAFAKEIVPVSTGSGPKAKVFAKDEGFRSATTVEALARLKPAFGEKGSVTAGNASMLSDGAAAVVVASNRALERLGTRPLARIVAYATGGVAPKDIFLAPVPAVRLVLERAGMTLDQVDLIEMNEAFAAQMLACAKELTLKEEIVNVNGGAIALGHPIGASGARVLVTLLSALEERRLRFGLAALCLGGGNAVAMIVERLPQT
jgi:acetyl-CoA C-acetyltransferase